MPTLFLNQEAIRGLLKMSEVITVVEQAFRDWAQGRGSMPAKAYLPLEQGDFRAMPAALPGAAGVKWVNVHPQNSSRGLPTIMAISASRFASTSRASLASSILRSRLSRKVSSRGNSSPLSPFP